MNTADDLVEVLIPEDRASGCSSKFSFKKLWAFTGPGWLMSIAYLDPGNIAGDLQSGVYGGYKLLWVLLYATMFGLILQILAARLGVVTGRDLATVCREQFNKPTSRTLWVMAEIAIIGSDIQEVLGSAIALKLLFGLPLWLGALITICDTFTFLFLHFLGIRKLEAFFAFLISVMATCFWLNLLHIDVPVDAILVGCIVPRIPKGAVTQTIGLIGAVIMPHNLYLHSALVQSRRVDKSDREKIKEANKYFAIEAAISLFVSFLINMAVVCVFAYATQQNFAEKGEIELNNAHIALEGLLGKWAVIVWGVGLLAAGQSSTMTGTYSGQFVMQGFVELPIAPWKRVLVTRAIAIFPSLMIVIWGNVDNIDEYLNVLQSFQLPFALIPLLKFTSSRSVMGEFITPPKLVKFCSLMSVVVILLNFYQALFMGLDLIVAIALLFTLGVVYVGFLVYVFRCPIVYPYSEEKKLIEEKSDQKSSSRDIELKTSART